MPSALDPEAAGMDAAELAQHAYGISRGRKIPAGCGRAVPHRLPSRLMSALRARFREVRCEVVKYEPGDLGAESLAGLVVDPGVLPGEDAAESRLIRSG